MKEVSTKGDQDTKGTNERQENMGGSPMAQAATAIHLSKIDLVQVSEVESDGEVYGFVGRGVKRKINIVWQKGGTGLVG